MIWYSYLMVQFPFDNFLLVPSGAEIKSHPITPALILIKQFLFDKSRQVDCWPYHPTIELFPIHSHNFLKRKSLELPKYWKFRRTLFLKNDDFSLHLIELWQQ